MLSVSRFHDNLLIIEITETNTEVVWLGICFLYKGFVRCLSPSFVKMFSFVFVVCLGFSAALATAPPCNYTACKLPDCRCSDTKIPGGLNVDQVPQIVLLTFDDAVTDRFYNMFYREILKRTNPNGCPIGITFFASHEYCDYTLIHELWSKRHEIAVHSISHLPDTEYWRDANLSTWTNEMEGMRQILAKFANIPRGDLVGIRAPFLQTGGNVQFQMMQNEGFKWDCSMPSVRYADSGMWPFSLKYENEMDCPIGPCPTESFDKVWVIPMLDLFDDDKIECAMLDTCRVTNEDETYKLLIDNFERSYRGTRAPYGLYIHAAWFFQANNNKGHYNAYTKFLDYIGTLDDVYVITLSQALEWTRNPRPKSEMNTYAPWKASCSPVRPNCRNQKNCKLQKIDPETGGERYMKACVDTCPCAYPWVGDPLGLKCI